MIVGVPKHSEFEPHFATQISSKSHSGKEGSILNLRTRPLD